MVGKYAMLYMQPALAHSAPMRAPPIHFLLRAIQQSDNSYPLSRLKRPSMGLASLAGQTFDCGEGERLVTVVDIPCAIEECCHVQLDYSTVGAGF